MKGGGEPKVQQPEPDIANLDQSEIASNQEAKALPWFCGEQAITGEIITPIYDQFSKNVPQQGKK